MRSQIQPSGSASRIDSSCSTTLRSRSTSSAANSGWLSMSVMMSASSASALAGPSAKYATSSVSVYAFVDAPSRSTSCEMIFVLGRRTVPLKNMCSR